MAGSSHLVKELREKTGAGILDCQIALTENGNDIEKSIDYLRQKGLAAAVKKSGRETNQGLVHAYIHVTDNDVNRRGPAFGLGAFVLTIMWLIFMIRILLGI